MNLFIPSISILCNKNDFSKAGSKLSGGLLATNLALLKKYYQLAIVHIANAKSMLRNMITIVTIPAMRNVLLLS